MKKSELILFILIFLCDLLTKTLIDYYLELYESITVIAGFFSITHLRNTGMAWSLFSGGVPMFIVLTAIIIVVLIVILLKTPAKSKWTRIALVIILAGALGNFFDRTMLGFVRDMFDFVIFGYDFPVFNVADIAVCVGGFILVIATFFSNEESIL